MARCSRAKRAQDSSRNQWRRRVGVCFLAFLTASGAAFGVEEDDDVASSFSPLLAPTRAFAPWLAPSWESRARARQPWEGWRPQERHYLSLSTWSIRPLKEPGATSVFPLLGLGQLQLVPPALRSWAGGELTSGVRALEWSRDGVCASRAGKFRRVGGESAEFALLGCDGTATAEAIDLLSSLARTRGTPAPVFPLPHEPPRDAEQPLEWVQGIRLLHPRVFALLQQVVQAFPDRELKIYSGYRRDGATSYHRKGRAVDIALTGVPNEALFRFCRTLPDAGCGYYPNSKFVHIDARPAGTGHAIWIDASGPGERARYVDSWPGVLASGGYAWAPKRASRID